MVTRLVEKKRVRTIQLGWAQTLATSVGFDGTAAFHTFQDDVTLIGFEILGEFAPLDAHANADGAYNGWFELSRQAYRAMPGSIGILALHCVWTATIVIGGNGNRKELGPVFFPEGYGIEIDEGESVNFLAFLEYIGAGGDLNAYGNALLYYVER